MSQDKSYTNQIIPFIVTIFASFITVQYLYTITNQRELLCLVFVIIYLIISTLKSYIIISLYPDRKDGKVDIRRIYMVSFCDLLLSIIIVILTKLIFDIFSSVIVKLHMKWYDYMVAISITIVFVFSFIKSTE